MTHVQSINDLLAKLKSVLIRQRLVMFSAGLLVTSALILAIWISLSLLAVAMIIPVWLKLTLLAIMVGLALFGFTRFALRHLFKGSIEKVATSLENKYPDLKGRLIAAIDFSKGNHSYGASTELVELTIVQAIQKAGAIELNSVLSFQPVLKSSRYLAVSAIIGLAFLLLMPGLFGHSYSVYSNPTTEIAPPLGYEMVAAPGTTEWVRYRDIEIGAALIGGSFPEKAKINYRLMEGNWQQTEIDLATLRRHPAETGDSLLAAITLRQINRSFDYFVEAGRTKTEVQRVDVVDRPRVSAMKLSIFYPDYTGLPPTTIDENNGSFSAVVGSRVNLAIESNPPAEKAEIIFDDESRSSMDTQGKTAETSISVMKSRSYHIRLTDHMGENNPDPIEYHITAIPDEYPSIDVLTPGFNVNLNDDMALPLKVRIFDDFGFSSLVLKFTHVAQGKRSEENVAVINFSDRIKTEGDVSFNWDLDRLNMYPGDYVQYHFEISDNDQINGPKLSQSKQFIARLPSLDEMIAETESETTERIEKTEDVLKRGKELTERLKQSSRKLKSQDKTKGKTEWQEQKDIKDIAQQSEKLLQDIEKLGQQMEKSLEKMSDQALMSRDILEKLAEIQKLFEEIATPEMKEAQRKLMEALEEMNRKQLSDAAEDLELSQEEMMERLERTLSLLKKMQALQKMEEMTRRVEQLAEKQEQMNQDTESRDKENLPELSEGENKLKEELENLKEDAKELDQMLKEAEMETSEAAKEFSEAVKKTDADKDMQAMSEAMEKKDKESASEEGESAHSKLMEMMDQMQQQMMAMKGADEEKLKKMMRLAIEQAKDLSKNQEEMLVETSEIAPRSEALFEMAGDQKDLVTTTEALKKRVNVIGKASPFIAAEIGQLIGNAISSMEIAVDNFSEKQGHKAQTPQRTAMADLNKVALRLLESMQQQNDSQEGSQCSNPMQQLESMCEKQGKLNQESKKECNNPGNSPGEGKQGKPSPEALKKLSQEQGTIRKSMEQLAQEFGNSKQILGRLDDIAKEMKKVEEALENGEIGPETAERQLKIYSRMMEASRSLQRKDFSEQRKATTSDAQAIYLPPSLTDDLLGDKSKLEDRLKQFLGEGYPKQYEEQVKAYFKALLQIESDQHNSAKP